MTRRKKVAPAPSDREMAAPREDQIAGIVQRVWADSQLYHSDVEPMLRYWLSTVGCVVTEQDFAVLLRKARGEFDRVSTATEEGSSPHCPAQTFVECLYWDVQTLERRGTSGVPIVSNSAEQDRQEPRCVILGSGVVPVRGEPDALPEELGLAD